MLCDFKLILRARRVGAKRDARTLWHLVRWHRLRHIDTCIHVRMHMRRRTCAGCMQTLCLVSDARVLDACRRCAWFQTHVCWMHADAVLGFLPCGTGGDFRRALGWDTSKGHKTAAIRRILAPNVSFLAPKSGILAPYLSTVVAHDGSHDSNWFEHHVQSARLCACTCERLWVCFLSFVCARVYVRVFLCVSTCAYACMCSCVP